MGVIDREKVIKALECRKNADKRCENPCEETGICHYATAVRDINGEIYRPFICDRERICTDVIDLLKEKQEERKRMIYWLGKFCRHIDNGDKWLSDKENIEFFREKMKQQFGWFAD